MNKKKGIFIWCYELWQNNKLTYHTYPISLLGMTEYSYVQLIKLVLFLIVISN